MTDYERGEDVLDIWFDSGVTWAAVLPGESRLLWPSSSRSPSLWLCVSLGGPRALLCVSNTTCVGVTFLGAGVNSDCYLAHLLRLSLVFLRVRPPRRCLRRGKGPAWRLVPVLSANQCCCAQQGPLQVGPWNCTSMCSFGGFCGYGVSESPLLCPVCQVAGGAWLCVERKGGKDVKVAGERGGSCCGHQWGNGEAPAGIQTPLTPWKHAKCLPD